MVPAERLNIGPTLMAYTKSDWPSSGGRINRIAGTKVHVSYAIYQGAKTVVWSLNRLSDCWIDIQKFARLMFLLEYVAQAHLRIAILSEPAGAAALEAHQQLIRIASAHKE